jgi:hypothetical protein
MVPTRREKFGGLPERQAPQLFCSMENDLGDHKFKVGQSVLDTIPAL